MEDVVALVTALGNLAPWVAALCLVVVVIFRWFKYREKKLEVSDSRALAKSLADLDTRTQGSISIGVATKAVVDTTLQALNTHNTLAEARAQQQLIVFRDILKQLITLNASTSGVLTPDNAKRLIQYQWNWCRDETARLIADSLVRNHFRGNETTVANNVYRAWVKTAKSSLDSIEKFNGISYPYAGLYTHHVDMVWKLIWAEALPLYHAVRPKNAEDYREVTDAFEDRIVALFDQVFQLHVEITEDIETGILYTDQTEDISDVIIPEDTTAPEVMGRQLREWTSSDDKTDRRMSWSRESVKAKMLQQLQQRSRWKTRSSVSIPAAEPKDKA